MVATNVKKKGVAQVQTKKGGQYSYKYTDLATIHEEMERQGLTYYQYSQYDADAQADYIYTALMKDNEMYGEPLRGARIIVEDTLNAA